MPMRSRTAFTGLSDAGLRAACRAGAAVLACLVVLADAAHATQALPPAAAQAEPEAQTRTAPAAPLIPYSGALSFSPGKAETAGGADPSRATLAPGPAASDGVDEVEIAARPTVVFSARSTWDKGFDSLAATFRALDEIVMAAGFDVRGRPFAVFVDTDEAGFRYEAMLAIAPVEDEARAAEALRQAVAEHAGGQEGGEEDRAQEEAGTKEEGGTKEPAPDVRLGVSPSGKAYRFVHASPYDDIDAAYEAITTYLDGKNIVVRDAFIEEYVTDLTLPTDEALEVNIYVQPLDPGARPQQPGDAQTPE